VLFGFGGIWSYVSKTVRIARLVRGGVVVCPLKATSSGSDSTIQDSWPRRG
jgi:hypothetical protein